MDVIGDAARGLGLSVNSKKTTNMLLGDHHTPPDALSQLSKIRANKKFTVKTKMRFYNPNILLTLIHGCDTSHIQPHQAKKLDAFDSTYIRKILGIKWSNFITINDIANTEVRDRSKQTPVTNRVMLRHVSRLPPTRFACQMLRTPEGRRVKGRPNMSWHHNIQRDFKRENRGRNDVRMLTADRSNRTALTASCVGSDDAGLLN